MDSRIDALGKCRRWILGRIRQSAKIHEGHRLSSLGRGQPRHGQFCPQRRRLQGPPFGHGRHSRQTRSVRWRRLRRTGKYHGQCRSSRLGSRRNPVSRFKRPLIAIRRHCRSGGDTRCRFDAGDGSGGHLFRRLCRQSLVFGLFVHQDGYDWDGANQLWQESFQSPIRHAHCRLDVRRAVQSTSGGPHDG